MGLGLVIAVVTLLTFLAAGWVLKGWRPFTVTLVLWTAAVLMLGLWTFALWLLPFQYLVALLGYCAGGRFRKDRLACK